MQNSGLGNIVNPLLSLADQDVYSIPMLLMIGWRGSNKKKDEPQHKAKGAITPNLLKLLNIDYCIIRTKKDLPKFNKLIVPFIFFSYVSRGFFNAKFRSVKPPK